MFKSTQNNLNEFLEKAGAITENSSSYFKGMIGQINLFSSSEALMIADQIVDETHYLLVPDRDTELGYSLFTKRVLPEGFSAENDLPKHRVFQLPNLQSIEILELLLHQELQNENLNKLDTSSPIAERLDTIAKEIDEKSNHITNGLLIIGGVVAITNPLLGVGIAVKALLPSLTSKVTTSGLDHLSKILKNKKKESAEKDASKEAKKDIKKLAPEIKINPTLELLHQALHTIEPDHDPLTENIQIWDNLQETKHIFIASEAISTIYAKRIKNNTSSYLHPNDIAWLKSLSAYT